MNWQQVEGNWKPRSGNLWGKWGQPTDNNIQVSHGIATEKAKMLESELEKPLEASTHAIRN